MSFNPYALILGAAALGGLGVAAWGWRVLQRSRRAARWPSVEGEIVESRPAERSDLVPRIAFRYVVQGREYRCPYRLPEGAHPFSDYSRTLLDRYPVGARVTVHYDPDDPARATLEPPRVDWLPLALGLAVALGAILALLLA